MKRAVLFVGQGSQYENMGIEFFDTKQAKEKLKIAQNILGYDPIEVLRNKNNELADTKYSQTMIALVTIIMFDEYKVNQQIDGYLGFSLGEYVALYAANIFTFEEIIKIIDKRANLMAVASTKNLGKMVAVLNQSEDVIKEIIKTIGSDDINIANYNARNQLVVSGSNQSISKFIELCNLKGIRRTIELKVSGAFHSKLMTNAGIELIEYLSGFNPKENTRDIYMNVNAKILDFSKLYDDLEAQIKSPVLFYQSIEAMIKDGYTDFVEIGPGKVLSQILKKNYQDITVDNIENRNDLERVIT